MENLWNRANYTLVNMRVGDFYLTGEGEISVVKRTRMRVYFSNGDIVTITKSKYGFYHLVGKRVDQILRDIEGYLCYKIHVS